MKIRDQLANLKIPDLKTKIGNGYLSVGSRQGGSYLNNYHKSLPSLLLGTVHNSSNPIHVSCEDVYNNTIIEIKGIVENEYLLDNLDLFVLIGEEVALVERVPYAEWKIYISASDIYSSNLQSIQLKLEGLNSEGKLISVTESLPISLEENCIASYSTESVVNHRRSIPLNVVINGESIQANSLSELKEALLNRGVELIIYQRQQT